MAAAALAAPSSPQLLAQLRAGAGAAQRALNGGLALHAAGPQRSQPRAQPLPLHELRVHDLVRDDGGNDGAWKENAREPENKFTETMEGKHM